jgi:hypothetical protein
VAFITFLLQNIYAVNILIRIECGFITFFVTKNICSEYID